MFRGYFDDELRKAVRIESSYFYGRFSGERYRLDGEGDYEKEKMAKRVFNKAATKVVRDSFSNARIQAIVNFHKRVKNLNVKKTPDLKKMHLDVEELIQGEIDWIMKDPEAWRWICHHWAGSDFQGASDRNRGNRTSKPGKQRFGADGLIGKEQRMYKENVIRRHGPEFDWRAGAPDVEAIYDAGGGLRHGRCHLTTSAVLSTKEHHLEMLGGWLGSNAPSFDLHNSSHRFHLTTSPLLPAKDHHLEMLGGSRPPLNRIIPSVCVNISQFELL
ncbi:hypothetical protein U9M48_024231 [Paspalum notatum var. saurae]|uniref:Uncharacterized protein n=1 Tax=Paspalum notatum var. saurae TaxID=547442 RepID=A0AAQ3WVS7_PASNO